MKSHTLLHTHTHTHMYTHTQNEPIKAENAIVMIARSPSEKSPNSPSSPPPTIDNIIEEADSGPPAVQSPFPEQQQVPIPEPPSTAGLNLDMQAARPQKKATKRAQVKQQDWRSAVKAYNAL